MFSKISAILKKIRDNKDAMEHLRKNAEKDQDIVFSKAIRAGKRIYYIDVKKNRRGEMYLAVTESKRIISDDCETPTVNFEKHKIFLYQEDFGHFTEGLNEAIGYIRNAQEGARGQRERQTGEIKIDIDF